LCTLSARRTVGGRGGAMEEATRLPPPEDLRNAIEQSQSIGVALYQNDRVSAIKEIVRRARRRKVFLIIDNGPCHNLDEDGKRWLRRHRRRIQLFRLPPYSPELNPIEGVWKATKKLTTHNRFYRTTDERDDALRSTFGTFQARPSLIANHVSRFL
jgi:transposase